MLIAERFRSPALALALFAGSLALPAASPHALRPPPSSTLLPRVVPPAPPVLVLHVPPAPPPVLVAHLSRRGIVHVTGSGLPAESAFVLSIDSAWPHASVACTRERTRQIRTDSAGHFSLELHASGECRFTCDEYRAYLAPSMDADDVARSEVFACTRTR